MNNTPVNGLLFWNKQIEGSCLLISRMLLAFQGSFCCCFFQRNTAFQSFTLTTNNNKAGFWNTLRSRRLRIWATVLPFLTHCWHLVWCEAKYTSWWQNLWLSCQAPSPGYREVRHLRKWNKTRSCILLKLHIYQVMLRKNPFLFTPNLNKIEPASTY